MNCRKMDLIESLQRSFVKVRKRSNFDILLLFGNFLKNSLIIFLKYFLSMILINCQEMDMIELFKRSFPWKLLRPSCQPWIACDLFYWSGSVLHRLFLDDIAIYNGG